MQTYSLLPISGGQLFVFMGPKASEAYVPIASATCSPEDL
jgi:hypothetical protein